MNELVDVHIFNNGTLVGFQPISDAAIAFFDEEVESEPWQWLGSTLWIDARMAGDLFEGLEEAGLSWI